MPSGLFFPSVRPVFASTIAVLAWIVGFQIFPGLKLEVFARVTAMLAALFLGGSAARTDTGWMLPHVSVPCVVTTDCSAADYTLLAAALIAWRAARSGRHIGMAVLLGSAFSGPFAIGVNALRVTVVTQAHRWAIPLAPESYGHFLHLLIGAAVFLPCLIALNALLHAYERHARSSQPDPAPAPAANSAVS